MYNVQDTIGLIFVFLVHFIASGQQSRLRKTIEKSEPELYSSMEWTSSNVGLFY
jgi:hypothetical protein